MDTLKVRVRTKLVSRTAIFLLQDEGTVL